MAWNGKGKAVSESIIFRNNLKYLNIYYENVDKF